MKLNDNAPNITLTNASGHDFDLSQQLNQGKWQLVIFFRGSWCPACREEIKTLQEAKSYFDKHDVQITLITQDDPSALQQMITEDALAFDILVDRDLQATKAYDVYYHSDKDDPYNDHGEHVEPAYFLLDDQGRVMYMQRQTNPFGRPTPKELRKTVQYIRKNLNA